MMGSWSRHVPRKNKPGDKWSELELIAPGYNPYWRVRCPIGHESLMNGNAARARLKLGKTVECEVCAMLRESGIAPAKAAP